MTITELIIRSPKTEKEWEQYFRFRWELLRKPLGMSRGEGKDGIEQQSFHLMVTVKKNNIIGVGRVHFNNREQAQIRYMAVKVSKQRTGIGTIIVHKLEEYSLKQKRKEVVLNSRENSKKFYLSLGYEEMGPFVSETGIPHVKMRKNL
ncbi:MAG: GNAT family N-acetyltransferase [Pseudomonadota bacterium]|nr:GNAT family N-acetyltransferase [Pseudomonadota bacterium]